MEEAHAKTSDPVSPPKRMTMTESTKQLLGSIQPWQTLIAIIVAIVGGIWGARAWVHNAAQSAVLEERFLATLASRVRPACVFDSNGAIEADLGAGDYIEGIGVTFVPNIYGFEINIQLKRHLAYAPLIVGVDADLFEQSAVRGKLHDWKIVVAPNSTAPHLLAEGTGDTNHYHRFKLEILH